MNEGLHAVWKFALQGDMHVTLALPRGAKILKVDMQHDRPFLWALVDPTTTETERRTFMTLATGEETDLDLRPEDYIGTWTIDTAIGVLVWHVFEHKEGEPWLKN